MEALKRVSSLVLLVTALVTLAACSSPPPPPPPPPKQPELSPETSAKIDEALDLLNNPNVEERWRNQLASCASAEPADLSRRAVIDRTVAAVKRSYAVAPGPGVLKSPGRRRAIEVLDKVGGDDPACAEVFKQGAKEPNAEVCAAAAAALLARGDEGALAALLSAARLAGDDPEVQGRASQSLVKLAKPERLDAYLRAMDPGCRKALTPPALACLPAEPAARLEALRGIARSHENPQARIFALDELALAKDESVPELARGSLATNDKDLRARCLELLAAQGGSSAVRDLSAALSKDPEDADLVAKKLSGIDSPEVIASASALLLDTSRGKGTRAAVARHVLGRMKDKDAPASLREPAARERGLTALRRAIEDSTPEVARAAIESLGASGDESDAEALVLLLANKPDIGESVIIALGKLGGSLAVQTLVEKHEKDARLRPAAKTALIGLKSFDRFESDDVMSLIKQLLSEDLDLRKSALAVLKSLKGDSDVHDFDPSGDPTARKRSVERWREWWKLKAAERAKKG